MVEQADRYVSFCGIDCDRNADQLVERLELLIEQHVGSAEWCEYFLLKRREQKKMQRDNLHFIGNQLNPLYEYFTGCDDQQALELLYQIEQECC